MTSLNALASNVIPAIAVLQRLLTTETEEKYGVKMMKYTLLAAVKKHFSDVAQNPLYCIATVLDPR